MKPIRTLLLVASMVLCCSSLLRAQNSIALTTLVSFHATNGTQPYSKLLLGQDGNLYGTTHNGGTNGDYGTVFKLTANGTLTTLVSFNNTNGAYPTASLIQATDGNFYGTTGSGGTKRYGTVFKLTTTGIFTSLVSLSSSNNPNPEAALIQASDGYLYGTTAASIFGGIGLGTIFKITTNGDLTTFFSFSRTTGSFPDAALIQGIDGVFYGTTQNGQNGSSGTVFKITTIGALTSLVSFNITDGAHPNASLVQAGDGNFYGTTTTGGTNGGFGTVFKMTPDGTLSTLVSFNGVNGSHPDADLLPASDGSFYGTTYDGGTNGGYGTVFQLTASGILTSLCSFNSTNGAHPHAALIQDQNGYFYGTTAGGGDFNSGTVFRFSPILNPPGFQSVTQASGAITLGWTASPGQNFQVQYQADPSQSNWLNLGGVITATNSYVAISDVFTNSSQRFYRLVLLP